MPLFFEDMENHWGKMAVDYLVGLGVTNGKTETTFVPDDIITRAEFVTMLMRGMDVDLYAEHSPLLFDDADQIPSWAVSAVGWSADTIGWPAIDNAKGVSFTPNEPITRQDMLFISYGAVVHFDLFEEITEASGVGYSAFADSGEVDGYAREGVNYFTSVGIVKGSDGKLLPNGISTRVQGAQFLFNLFCPEEYLVPKSPERRVDFYFDYFGGLSLMQVIVPTDESFGEGAAFFTDDQMAAFAFNRIITEKGEAYDYEIGFEKELFNEMTLKYFGREIANFDNQMTKVIEETGHVTATGWSFDSGTYFILKSRTEHRDDTVTAVFYYWNVGDSIVSDNPAMWLEGKEHIKEMLAGGTSGILPSVIRMTFVESADSDNYFIRFISCNVFDDVFDGEITPYVS